MRGSTVLDQMTRDVVTVGVDTPYKQIAQLLAESKVSGLPVVHPAGHVVGVVTEADLLAGEEYPDEQGRRRPVLPLPGASWAFCSMRGSPGAKTYYQQLREHHIGHQAPLRQLAGRLVGILHGCLKTGTTYDEHTAWVHHTKAAA
jgi:CBS-domain-containing membrane protein